MRQIFGAVALTLLLTAWAPAAKATIGWFVVEVGMTGMASGELMLIRLTDTADTPAFAKKWFMASDLMKKEMLAIALTTMVSDNLLRVRVDPDLAGFPEIKTMYMRPR